MPGGLEDDMSRIGWLLPLLALVLAGCQPAATPPVTGVHAPEVPRLRPAIAAETTLTTLPAVALPAPTPRVPPAPAPQPARFAPAHDLLAFVSDRGTSGGDAGGFDIYLYDATDQTVWAPPGANTRGDEFNPSTSHDNQWLVYATNAPGDFDIRLYDLRAQLVNDLSTLNTTADDVSPTINGDGTLLAYTSREGTLDRLHVFDLRTGANYVPAAVARLETTIFNPFITADGKAIAFSAPVEGQGLDIMFYDVTTAAVWRPPFVNTSCDEDEPVVSPGDRRLAFSTNRTGDKDVMLVDLASGYLDRLPLANSAADDLTPAFLGAAADRLVFVSDRAGERRLYVYQPTTAVLDTLPIAHEPGRVDTFSAP
jgi:Tol biopolymer transport system component